MQKSWAKNPVKHELGLNISFNNALYTSIWKSNTFIGHYALWIPRQGEERERVGRRGEETTEGEEENGLIFPSENPSAATGKAQKHA
jgi:hypothetical protein